MWNFFFGKKQESNSEKEIQKLKEQISLLEKREKLLQKKIEQEQIKAKECLNKNKNEAIKILKTKKLYEEQLQNLQTQKFNIETMINKIEETIVNVDIIKSQQKASNTLKNLYKDIDIENIDKKMDEIRDTFDKSKEINDLLSQPIHTIDESEIMDELEDLQSKIISEEIKVPKTLPFKNIINKEKEEEKYIKELQAELV